MSAPRKAIGEHRSSWWQESDGSWRGKVAVGRKPNGALAFERPRRPTEDEVRDAVREIERKRDARTKVYTAKNPTLNDWAKRWLEVILPNANLRPQTIGDYRSKLKCHVLPVLGDLRLSDLGPEHFQDLYADMKRAGESQSVISGSHAAIRSCLKYAVRQRTLGVSPLDGVSVAAPQASEVDPYTPEETRNILDTARETRNGVRFAVALALGLRQSEALGLRWAHVDFDTATMWIRKRLRRETGVHGCDPNEVGPSDDGRWPCGYKYGAYCPDRLAGGLKLDDTKTTESKRPVPIPEPLLLELKAHKRAQAAERLAAGDLWEDTDLVFTTEVGRALDPSRDWSAWKRLIREAGVPDKRLHDARHTAATTLLVMGVDSRTVMAIMGWTEQKTAKRYTHVVDVLRKDAADRIGQALWADEA